MNFALLGSDSTFIPLLRTLSEDSEHQLVRAIDASDLHHELIQIAPGVQLDDKWDDLVSTDKIDAVIVASNDEATLSIAKQAAASGKRLLLLPRMHREIAIYYELALIHDDTQVLLFPFFPDRFDAGMSKAKQLLESGSVGNVLRFQLDRELESNSGQQLDAEQIDDGLMLDVDAIRLLGGEYNQVTAIRSGQSDDGISMQSVALAGDQSAEATIQHRVSSGRASRTLSVIGDLATLEIHFESSITNVTLIQGEQTTEQSVEQIDQPAELLHRFTKAVAGEKVMPNWTDAIRAYEVVEATTRSLRRRRTIDLHFESTSERSLFKTQMTAIGCGLLLLTLFMMLGLLALGAFLDPSDSVESKAAAADFIIRDNDFSDSDAKPPQALRRRLSEIADRMRQVNASILMEKTADDALDQRRQTNIVEVLSEFNAQDADSRVLIAEITGDTARTIMKVARFAWMLPLLIFLGLQALIVITKPATKLDLSSQEPGDTSSDIADADPSS